MFFGASSAVVWRVETQQFTRFPVNEFLVVKNCAIPPPPSN
jgi:hypothetical protein